MCAFLKRSWRRRGQGREGKPFTLGRVSKISREDDDEGVSGIAASSSRSRWPLLARSIGRIGAFGAVEGDREAQTEQSYLSSHFEGGGYSQVDESREKKRNNLGWTREREEEEKASKWTRRRMGE